MARRGDGPRRMGASLSRALLRDRYRAWQQHHRLSAADSLHRILESPVSSLLTCLVIGIALALPVSLDVALDNIGRLGGAWDSPAQISLFLGAAPAGGSRELAAQLHDREDIARATFVPREQALEEFSGLSGFGDILSSLEENPLPDLVLVNPRKDLSQPAVAALREELLALPEVEEAVLDLVWLQRLQALMGVGRRIVLAMGGVLVLGAVLILGNTIRLAIENRREEIVVVKLVGGSNGFVRRPFLYTGLWYGVGGGLVGALLVTGALWYLAGPVGRLAASYDSDFRLAGPGFMGVLELILVGGLAGLAGAWLAVARHLRAIQPR